MARRDDLRQFALAGIASALFAATTAQSEEISQPPAGQAEQLNIDQFKRDLEKQAKALDTQKRALEEQEKRLANQKRELDESRNRLDNLKARIDSSASKNDTVKLAQAEPSPAQPVGQAPEPSAQPAQPPVAPIFEQPGVLTQRGKIVLEPSLQYSYTSTYRVALLGYTIIPAIHIGVIDIRGVNDSTWIGAMTARYGMTNRLEFEVKVPYTYRTESTVIRPVGGGSTDVVFDTKGHGIGDIEIGARYQINETSTDTPYYIAGLRVKARNGTDPFSIPQITLSDGKSQTHSGLATGSGFVAVQPSVSFIYPTDPAVFFGGINYVKNFDRYVGSEQATIHPGNAAGLNFGMGLAMNEKASFSIGVDYTYVEKPRASGGPVQLFSAATSTQLATLLFGYSYRFTPTFTTNFSVGAGLTPETPGVQMMLRVPMTF